MRISRKMGWALIALSLLVFAFSLFHASWLAPSPSGIPKLVAMDGVDLPTDKNGCIIDANSGYGAAIAPVDIRVLQGAMGVGADAIAVPNETKSGKLFVKRQFKPQCDADAARPMAPLSDIPANLSAAQLFIPIGNGADASAMLGAVPAGTNIVYYGDKQTISALRKAEPKASAFSIDDARQCVSDYRSGLFGSIPEICKNGWALLTLDDLGITLWGWPNKFLDRMAGAGTNIIIAQNVKDGKIIGLTQPDQYGDIASGYNGYIWVDNIAEMGPALKR